MICKICGGNTRVIDTAASPDKQIRRRKCKTCGATFYTVELKTDDQDIAKKLVWYKTKKS